MTNTNCAWTIKTATYHSEEEIIRARSRLRAAFVVVVSLAFAGCTPVEPAGVLDASGGGGESGGAALALPVTISDYFAPSGYMGDGATSPTAIVVQTMPCKQPRPPEAVGDCYHVTYKPGSAAWAGVYWQYPENNWGAIPGKQVEAGATKVTFYAAGAMGGEVIQFIAGGENDKALPYRDSFMDTNTITLSTKSMQYQIDLSGKTYASGVLGAFAWVAILPTGAAAPVEFYLDTIRWEK